ncbi:MAG: NUDIX domain-containing protein [Gammaproteobacteria bacterium]|nr:NUDIX domain-containing protein [Gammaproteobacteria bacterium]
MTRDDVELIEKRNLHPGFVRVDRYRLRIPLYQGGLSGELVRDVFDRGRVVAVLLLDPERDRVVLVEQFRPGPYVAGLEPWLIECVAGIIEQGENEVEVARRESLEETGAAVSDLVPLMEFATSPGACSETVTLFLARVDSRDLGGIHGLASEGENIKVLVLPVGEALELLASGRIVNAKTIIALQWLAANYADVKRRWPAPR